MNPKTRNIIVVVIVVGVVAAGLGYYLLRPQGCTKSLSSTNPLIIDQAEVPDSLDPGVTFSTPGWAAVQQVYQGLVNYNGSSYTSFSGVLAHNWTESSDGMHWNFTLRSGIHFSNGHPVNAYVMWYSLYRSLLLEQGPQFILEQNFYSPSLNASYGLTYYSNLTLIHQANATLVSDLNSFNFDNPTPSEVAVMGMSNQSFQVLSPSVIELNLGFGYLATPYTYLLASISAPNSYAVDPVFVDAEGGVVEGQPNANLSTMTMGTGQYTLSSYNGVPGGGYTLTPDSHYWGASAAAAEPWNNMIQPAKSSVQVIFQNSQQVTVNDLENGGAAEASFAYLGPSTVNQLKGNSCVVVQALPTVYGATSGSWWIYLDQNVFPFNNLSVRMAIAHAIDYQSIISNAFGGYASRWVGPVPPSYPYYNPSALAPYSYNLTLARAEIADSPCRSNACAGTTFNYAYLSSGTDWADTAQILAANLAQIGITIHPEPISLANLYEEQTSVNGVCTTTTTANGGPFYIGQEFYTSDYISPDDWTQNNAYSLGSANGCMSGYANATVDTLVYQAAGDSNPANLTRDYTTMTTLMYQNYSDIWLVVPTSFAVYSTHLQGVIQNPMASAEPYALLFNTQTAS